MTPEEIQEAKRGIHDSQETLKKYFRRCNVYMMEILPELEKKYPGISNDYDIKMWKKEVEDWIKFDDIFNKFMEKSNDDKID